MTNTAAKSASIRTVRTSRSTFEFATLAAIPEGDRRLEPTFLDWSDVRAAMRTDSPAFPEYLRNVWLPVERVQVDPRGSLRAEFPTAAQQVTGYALAPSVRTSRVRMIDDSLLPPFWDSTPPAEIVAAVQAVLRDAPLPGALA